MCGIWGYANLNNQPRQDLKQLVRILALENQTRGRDSSGLAIIDQENKYSFIKALNKAEEFLVMPEVREKMNQFIMPDAKKIFGHARWSTVGEVNLLNTQPFLFKNILGIHNGTIWNHEALFREKGLTPTTTCDSEVIFALLSEGATLKERAKLLKEMTGNWAIAFHDFGDPNTLYFGRHNNPLTVAISEDRSFIVWSSLPEAISKAAILLDMVLKEVKIPEDMLVSIGPDGKTRMKQAAKPWPDYASKNSRRYWRDGRWTDDKHEKHEITGFNKEKNQPRLLAITPGLAETILKPLEKRPGVWGSYVWERECTFCGTFVTEARYHFEMCAYLCKPCLVMADENPKEAAEILGIDEKDETSNATEEDLAAFYNGQGLYC